MADMDDRLQAYLEALEHGAAPDELATGLTGEDQSLAPLIALAATLREMPRPKMAAGTVKAQHRQVMAAAVERASTSGSGHPTGARWLIPGLIAVLSVVLVCMAALTAVAGGSWLSLARRSSVARLMDVRGKVELAAADAVGGWQAVTGTTALRAGQRVRTGPASSATLVFHEGSVTMVGPNTDLTLTSLKGGLGGTLQVALTQVAGETAHRVVPLRGVGSFFMVDTPSGEARVRGTTFHVAVQSQGGTRFAVDSGRVAVATDEREVVLVTGQVTTALPDGSLAAPAFQFSGRGQILAINGTTWSIGGVPVAVINQTEIAGDPAVGDIVAVTGRLLDDSLWLADAIEIISESMTLFDFAGVIEEKSQDRWRIGAVTLALNADTDVAPDLKLGERVRAQFTVLDNGTWLALQIQALEESPEEPTPTPTATPDPGAQPILVFDPGERAATRCTTTYPFTGTLVNLGEQSDDLAANVELGYVLLWGAEFVEAVDIHPSTWETLAAGEAVPFEVTVTLAESWLQAPAESKVALELFVARETNLPEQHGNRMVLSIVSSCEATPTPTGTPTSTATPTLTPTFTPTPTATPTPIETEAPPGAKVTICHIPPGNPSNAHTITIGRPALPAHLAHGDTIGPCP